jgi:hypothetical protein
VIPSFMKRLEDDHEDIRWETVEIIGVLANHGEREMKGLQHS